MKIDYLFEAGAFGSYKNKRSPESERKVVAKELSHVAKSALLDRFYMKIEVLVNEYLEELNYSVINIDATVIAQAPKLAPHIEKMRENIASALKIDITQVNVKATTEEKLGFTGEKLGIAAHAVCLIQ
jgi:2-C-methyl-D-erythritol 2,4-cyclodiphosphate synthase